MREHVLSLSVQGGDRVSAEFLAATLHRRAAALVDDPEAALFFGRTDHDSGECWYIGRRHVTDAQGDPLVIDWRADVSRGFYRASRTEPMGIVRRRRFGLERGNLTAYEDEDLRAGDDAVPVEPEGSGTAATLTAATGSSAGSILSREIERPRVGPMRDIVATIQPEQDVIVRAGPEASICVQGAPGTGKTAVGLHRAAWLLYAHRDRLSRSGVLVIGPNAAFLEHVAAVLPSLGEVQVRHVTVDALVRPPARPVKRAAGAPSRRRVVVPIEPVATAMLKGDERMAELLRRAVWEHVSEPDDALVLPRGSRRWRLAAHEIREIVEELRGRGVRYLAARDMLARRLAHAILLLMEAAGDSPDDRVQDAVARSREVRQYVDKVWPRLTSATILFELLSDPEWLARTANGLFDAEEQRHLLWPAPPRSAGSARWTPADAVLLDELGDLLTRTASLGHVVLDEAQDLSAMQLRAVGRRCSTGSLTVLGDLAQGTTPWSSRSWPVSLAHLGHPDATLTELDRGFRVPAAVIDFAAQLLPLIAPELTPPTSVRQDPGSLVVDQVAAQRLWDATLQAVEQALGHEGSVGLIVPAARLEESEARLRAAGVTFLCPGRPAQDDAPAGNDITDATGEQLLDAALGDDDTPLPRVSLIAANAAKGLEYDHVVVLEPSQIAAEEADEGTGLRRLYVVLTRAVSRLTVVHHEPLPPPLTALP